MNAEQLLDVAGRLAAHKLTKPAEWYEFGVLTGDSIIHMDRLLEERGVSRGQVWGFDSFQGLPPEKAGLPRWSEFRPGFFDMRQELDLATVENVIAFVRSKFSPELDKRVTLVPGFFEHTLTTALPLTHNMGSADWVYLDADLYISTYQALEWLVLCRLLTPGQTLLSYDEWNSAPGAGEERAHAEIADRFGLDFKLVWRGDNGLEQRTYLFTGWRNV